MHPAWPHPAPLNLPSAFCSHAVDPVGAPHTCLWGLRISIHPKLCLHGTSRLAGTLRFQFLRNPEKTHTPQRCHFPGSPPNAGPSVPPVPRRLLNAAPPAELLGSLLADWSPKPRLLYRLRPGSDKTPPPGRQAPPSFLPPRVIPSGDWIVALGLAPRLTDSNPFSWRGDLAPE